MFLSAISRAMSSGFFFMIVNFSPRIVLFFTLLFFNTSLAFTYCRSMRLVRPVPTALADNLRGNFVSVQDCIHAFHAAQTLGPKLVFVDGSWYLGKDRSARKEYEAGPRISGAKFFDIDDISSKGPLLNPKNLPHMMPPKELFASAMDALNIHNSDYIVVYGVEGCLFSTRAWYTFREMGHAIDRIHLMQGTLQEWMELGGEIEHGPLKAITADELDLIQPTRYQARDSTSMVNLDTVISVVMGKSKGIILDARSEGRFKGIAPEPRVGLRGGCMPRSFNVPVTDLLDGKKYLAVENLKQVFKNAGVDPYGEEMVICSCGSGVTACVIASALEACGRDPKNTFIFDGSWIEWASDLTNPVDNNNSNV